MSLILELRRKQQELMRDRGIKTLQDYDNSTYPLGALTGKYREDKRPFFTGYDYGRLYGWDQYFEGILQIYGRWDLVYLQNSLKMFLESQDYTGFIPRTLPRVWWGEFHAQPFLAQQALLLLRAGDDISWLYSEYYYRLKNYLLYWLNNMDMRKKGLSIWDHAAHSGMDDMAERAGKFYDRYCEGVDLNSYLVRECKAFVLLAKYFNCSEDSEIFTELAEQRRRAINKWCWNEKEGIYYDYHARKKCQINVKYVGTFAALWAKVASDEQANQLVINHLLNEKEFARPWPLPALSATEPGYVDHYYGGEVGECCPWRAHTYMSTNYYTFQGLRYYGHNKAAESIAIRSREMFCCNPFREYYSSETGVGCGLDPFWGWSALALYMEEELEKDVDPTQLEISQIEIDGLVSR